MKISPLFIYLLLLVMPRQFYCQAQQPNYLQQHYLFQDRLARGLVFDILQDKWGLMWFATEYGLIRYDGSNLKTYQNEPGNPFSLAGNVISCIAEDEKGNLWVGTLNKGLHYFDRRTGQFHRYESNPNDPHSIGSNKINDVVVDKSGAVWVATEGTGVNLFNRSINGFIPIAKSGPKSWNANELLEDTNGNLWQGAYFGLSQWIPADSNFLFRTAIEAIDSQGVVLKTLAQDENGNIWAGFRNGGLVVYQPELNQLRRPDIIPDWPGGKAHNHIWDIFVDSGNHIWVGTDSSLFFLQRQETGQYVRSWYLLSQERRYLSIYKSTDDVMWIGTNDGVVVLAPRQKQFQLMTPLKPGEPPANTKRGATAICEGEGDQIWIGTIRGLFQCDINGPRLHRDYLVEHPLLSQFENSNISAIHQDKTGRLWVGIIEGFNMGFALFQYDLNTKKLMEFSKRDTSLTFSVISSIAEDEAGHLWFGNSYGMLGYKPEIDSLYHCALPFDQIQKGERITVNHILANRQEELWIGMNDVGLIQKTGAESSYSVVSFDDQLTSDPANRRIITIVEDAQKRLWLGTAGGLIYFNPADQSLKFFDKKDGLPNNVIKSINLDQNDQVWVGSQTGLCRFDSEKQIFIDYGTTDGVELNEYWDRASFLDKTGRLYFGGDDGLLVFHPDNILHNQYVPPVLFTRFSLFNQEVLPDSNTKLLPVPLEYKPTLRLRHDQNVFSIHFSALSYINPQKAQYAIKMEGFEQEWQMIGNKTEATYTNLDPGTYFFKVKAANNDGVWNEAGATLKMIVLPPWYSTWWAYLSYLILLASGIYLFYRFQLNRRLAEVEARRLKELDAVKTQLYTNITHEFRTPLTLIQGPVDRALEEPTFSLGKRELERIRRNCNRLLRLIQQMLNLNKLEAGALQPDYRYGDIIPALKYIVDSFQSFAESQKVDLELTAIETELWMDFDQEKVFDILSNLLSNAIKFTPSGGEVRVEISADLGKGGGWLHIAVMDTGIGISPEAIDRIFDRFFQSNQSVPDGREESLRSGSGIGLAFSMRLAKLMGGTIKVSSKLEKGSTFMLQLPIRHTHQKELAEDRPFTKVYLPAIVPEGEGQTAKGINDPQDTPLILVVEDNADVARFINECLPDHFRKIMAINGREGIAMAREHVPDLIVSDVLMPEEDGFSLTEKLKQDQLTSHIPIILLTAKAELGARLEGFGKGADAYMAKPFNRQELLIRVENLLESRKRLQAYYLQQNGLLVSPQESKQAHPREHAFLKKTRTLIEKNIDEQSYSIEALASDLHMSPTQLYRKIKALTGQSPSKLLRHIQISRAKSLLIESDLNISEVGYKSGFEDPAYFTRVFTAQMGVSPTAFRENPA